MFTLYSTMPAKVKQKPLPTDIVAQIILGEAANQNLAGLDMVADTLYNRAIAQKKSLEDVATSPSQFSAYSRPDLESFYQRQPIYLQNYATALVEERRNPKFQPGHPYQHYVTSELWGNRGKLPKDHWLRNMREVKRVGDHVILEDAR